MRRVRVAADFGMIRIDRQHFHGARMPSGFLAAAAIMIVACTPAAMPGSRHDVPAPVPAPAEAVRPAAPAPAAPAHAFLSPLEVQVLAELNLARTDPRGYARHLEAMLPWYQGRSMREPGTNVVVLTQEGESAVREAIRALRGIRPLHELRAAQGLSRAARDHVRDQERNGGTGHTGRDGSSAADRVNRYGSWSLTLSENIAYGPPTAREVVIGLIVDDGVPGRGHRRNIFDPMILYAGIACGTHPQYRRMCVIKHAGAWADLSGAR